MTTASRNQHINELRSRIKLLEIQQGESGQHMHDKLLMLLVTESIQQADSIAMLLRGVLERMSVVLDLPFAAFCEASKGSVIPLEIYQHEGEGTNEEYVFSLSAEVTDELKNGPVFMHRGTEKFSEIQFKEEPKLKPQILALFPFQSIYIPFGVFVFFDDVKKIESLKLSSLVIQQLVSYALEKYEKLQLIDELKQLNQSFEEELDHRTQEIQKKYTRLEESTKMVQKRVKKPIPDLTKKEDDFGLLNSFLKSIGVEMRTPLNGIMGFAELIRDNDLSGAEKNKYIDIIKSCGKSLVKIVDDAKEFSSIKSGQVLLSKKEFALAPFMTDLYDHYKKDELFRQREKLELRINININGSTKIIADRDKLMLVLTNLIGNSIKFTGTGYIEFGCNIREPKSKRAKGKKFEVLFFVKDTGVGIAEDHWDKVYNEFYKVEHEISKLFGGLGLGLTIAKSLVEMMNGKLWFESDPGKETVFYFTIPEAMILSEAELEVLSEIESEKLIDWSNKKILIVEDDPMSVIYLKEALKSTGAQIMHVGDGTAAVELVNSETHIDCILMDIKLPGISGFEATKQIKSFSKVPIIAQTAYAMADDYKKIIQVGCDDYVSKPINRRKLLKKINDVFTRDTI